MDGTVLVWFYQTFAEFCLSFQKYYFLKAVRTSRRTSPGQYYQCIEEVNFGKLSLPCYDIGHKIGDFFPFIKKKKTDERIDVSVKHHHCSLCND